MGAKWLLLSLQDDYVIHHHLRLKHIFRILHVLIASLRHQVADAHEPVSGGRAGIIDY